MTKSELNKALSCLSLSACLGLNSVSANELDDFFPKKELKPVVSGVLSSAFNRIDFSLGNTDDLHDHWLRLESDYTFNGINWVSHLEARHFRASSEDALLLGQKTEVTDRYFDLTAQGQDQRESWSAMVDWFYAQTDLEKGKLTVGRFPITQSYGKIWSIADHFAPFSFFDLDRLYKQGVDATKLDSYLTSQLTLQHVLSLGRDEDKQRSVHFLQSWQWQGQDQQAMLNVAKRNEQSMLTFSFQKNNVFLGGDVYTELLLGYLTDYEESLWNRDYYNRAVIGLLMKVGDKSFLNVEAFNQNLTKGRTPQENQILMAQSQLTNMGLGNRYLAASITSEFSPLWQYELLTLSNLVDKSLSVSGLLKYSVRPDTELRFSASVSGQTGEQSAEFNLYPEVFQLSVYFYF